MKNEQKAFLQTLAQGLSTPPRTPILKKPDEYGMEYKETTIKTADGIELNAWFIPADSNKYIISNHFSPGNRYGFAGHQEPFTYAGGFEVNFLPRYKALHEAGYNVLTYDIRCHGESPAGKEGHTGVGYYEWEDVLASIKYVKELGGDDAKISLMSMCMGANATINAMEKDPEAFKDIISWIAVQPLKGRTNIERACEAMQIPVEEGVSAFEPMYTEITGLTIDNHDITKKIQFVSIPTFYLQVRNDMNSRASDVQWMYDNTKVEDKKITWVEETPWRFHGYTYFSEHPAEMVEWFDAHMK